MRCPLSLMYVYPALVPSLRPTPGLNGAYLCAQIDDLPCFAVAANVCTAESKLICTCKKM